MKKLTPWPLVVVLTVSFLVLQGCASSNKQFTNQNLSSLEPIKVCRYETPGIMKSTGTETALLALVTLAAPGGSALLVVGDEYAKARGSDTQTMIPDFGSLVMNKFLERIHNERSDRPALTVMQDPLKEDFSEKCTVMEFKVNRVAYGSIDLTRGGIALERGLDKGVVSNGFLSKATVTMKDSQGEVLWQKSYVYLSENFDRSMSVDELEADNFNLLREEMEFAAEKTAADFIEHLNGEPKEIAKVKE
ncbi:MAG: hypothetical protein M1508_12795 [Nitrospirae bacterium]|nr:hypothetical protein [Nitrospirota bacterium]MCL5422051.1 hypothetical protein [Nitrospirota bacterium]